MIARPVDLADRSTAVSSSPLGASDPDGILAARLSRRQLFKLAGGAAAGFAAAGGLPLPGPATVAHAASGDIVAYHDKSAGYHQNQFTDTDGLLKRGFRPISMSVYRDTSGDKYAAIWRQESGPAFYGFHNIGAAAYQNLFDTLTSQGFRPTIISGTGGGTIAGTSSEQVYAGLFIKDPTPFSARHNISRGQFGAACDFWKLPEQGFALRSAAILGDEANPRYAAIWEKAPGVSWDYLFIKAGDLPSNTVPLSHPRNSALKLSYVTRGSLWEYLAVYRSDQTGDRVIRKGMSSAEYQAEHDALGARGMRPVLVQAGGEPRIKIAGPLPPRFVAIFQR